MKKSQDPKISVIMSVYNGMPFLKDAVKSILNQTYKNFEFIIVNDASTDKSWQYLKSIKNKRLILVRNKENFGLAKSLNIALKKTSGAYIARMDADDFSLSKRLEKQIDYLLKNPTVDICGAWAKLIDEKNKVIGSVKKPLDDKNIKKMNMWVTGIIHPSWIVKREVYKKLNGYDTRFDQAEDLDFLIRASNFKMANMGKELILWRSNQKRRSLGNIEMMYKKSLSVRWEHFRKGRLPIVAIIYLSRSLVTTFLLPTSLKIFLNKKAGLM